ncbi:hypothetical protein [Candidatus Soleaferrea massiliensis]|uniref:hypothetical protein n=1 Tax=Candidatus Soleaferrea massiliensis TaxID=1470354 RepID=UPI0012E0908C|nr:hypothetical protein [Candidatus Soleaferrea massiliensis]
MKKTLSVLLALCMMLGASLSSLPALAQDAASDTEFVTLPPQEEYQNLWVGDAIAFGPLTGYSLSVVTDVTVLEGADVAEILTETPFEGGVQYLGLCLKRAGIAKAEVSYRNGEGPIHTKEITLKAVERPSEVTADPIERIRIGDTIDKKVMFHNVSYGSNLRVSVDDRSLFFNPGWGSGMFDLASFERDSLHSYSWGKTAKKPGEFLMSCEMQDQFDVFQKVGQPFRVTIEMPDITTNAPAEAAVGSTIDLVTALQNTACAYGSVESLAEDSKKDGKYYQIVYQASVEVLEGKDCVRQSEQDYSMTLQSKEKLTFLKPGTVKLKVAYKNAVVNQGYPADYEEELNDVYVPEKVITIQVKEPSEESSSSSGSNNSRPVESASESDVSYGKGNPATGDAAPIAAVLMLTAVLGGTLIALRRRQNA